MAQKRWTAKYRRSKWATGWVPKKGSVTNSGIPDWAKIRKRILDRDNYACRICGSGGDDAALNVHHIDWDRTKNHSGNLVTLCQPCHKAVHAEGYKPALFEDWPTPWGIIE